MAISTIGANSLAQSRILTAVQQPAGAVLQVVNATYSTQVSNTSNTYVDTGLTATITPTSSTSKILVLVSQNGIYKTAANIANETDLILLRNGTSLTPSIPFAGTLGETSVATTNSVTASFNYLDSPATTSAVTYKTQFASRNITATVYVQYANVSVSAITLLEISA